MYELKNNSYGVNKNIGFTNKKNNINFGMKLSTRAKMQKLQKVIMNTPMRPEYRRSQNINIFDIIKMEYRIFNTNSMNTIGQFLKTKTKPIKEKIITFLDQAFDIQIKQRQSKTKVNEKLFIAIDEMLKSNNTKPHKIIASRLGIDVSLLSALNQIPTRYQECKQSLNNSLPTFKQFKEYYNDTHHYNFTKLENRDAVIIYFISKYNDSKNSDSDKLAFTLYI